MDSQVSDVVQYVVDSAIKQDYDNALNQLATKSTTIMLVGATGVGKSSLINVVFGQQVATVGNGKPITSTFNKYKATTDTPVNLYDSMGWEPQDTMFQQRVREFIQSKTLGRITNSIHCVWYIVDAPRSRWTDGDTYMLKEVFSGVPVIIVLNKADLATEEQMVALEDEIISQTPSNINNIFRTAPCPKDPVPGSCSTHGSDDICVKKGRWRCDVSGCDQHGECKRKPIGINKLVTKTLSLLPEIVKESFVAAQKVNIEYKCCTSEVIIISTSLLVFATGWIPLPFVDAAIFGGAVTKMVLNVARIFGIERDMLQTKLNLQLNLVIAGMGTVSLLKIIPGVGSLIGGAVDSTISFIFTLTCGAMWVASFARLYKKALDLAAEERTAYFKDQIENMDIKSMFTQIRELLKGTQMPRSSEQLSRIVSEKRIAVANVLPG